jgi:two-component system, sensor histidine kinase PdtaS
MSDSVSAQNVVFQLPWERAAEPVRRAWRHNALTAELYAARAREEAWRREKSELLQRHDMLAQECEHRLVNSLQIIVSLLTLQSRTASPDAAAQLNIAARRIASFGRVHRTLHLLDHQDSVEFKQYLQHLCGDLSGLLFQEETGRNIVVEAAKIDLPTAVAVPLGFIVNELITNSAKYAGSNITVRLETTPDIGHSVSVLDDGPGLPEGFDPADSKGLGMKIVGLLVKQIGGTLQIASGSHGQGAHFTVIFGSPLATERCCHGA